MNYGKFCLSMVLVICLLLVWGHSSCMADFPIGYQSYTRWQQLPQLRLGAESRLASSYDRTGANNDWSWYEWPEGLISSETTCTVKTIAGPGVIYRFWMPHCISKDSYVVRMYFDGESTPRIDTMSDTIFDGLFSYFDAPFVDTCAGGQVCYEPINFSESVVIETVNHKYENFYDKNYYQYSYLTYPANIDVNSWTGTLGPDDQNDRNTAISIFDKAGQNELSGTVIVDGSSNPKYNNTAVRHYRTAVIVDGSSNPKYNL